MGMQHRLGDSDKLPRVADAQLKTHRFSAGQFAQLLDKMHHFHRGGEGAVRSRRNAVFPLGHAARGGNFRIHFFCRQNAAMARFGALAEFDFNHFYLRAFCLLGEALRIEMAVGGAAAEIAAAQFPHQIAAVLAVIAADAALAGVMIEIAFRCAKIEGADGVGRQRAEAHGGDIKD
ncbi:hypothetical protein D3C79_283130 [compost metagenome]